MWGLSVCLITWITLFLVSVVEADDVSTLVQCSLVPKSTAEPILDDRGCVQNAEFAKLSNTVEEVKATLNTVLEKVNQFSGAPPAPTTTETTTPAPTTNPAATTAPTAVCYTELTVGSSKIDFAFTVPTIISFAFAGDTLFGVNSEGIIYGLNSATGNTDTEFTFTLGGTVLGITYSSAKDRLYVCTNKGKIIRIKTDGTESETITLPDNPGKAANNLFYHQDTLYVAFNAKRTLVYHNEDAGTGGAFTVTYAMTDTCVTKAGQIVVMDGKNSIVYYLDHDGNQISAVELEEKESKGILCSSCGDVIVSTSASNKVWAILPNQVPKELLTVSAVSKIIDITEKGSNLYLLLDNGAVEVWPFSST